MRSLIQQLRLCPVEEGRLVSALQKHLTTLEDTDGLKVAFHVEGGGQLPADQEEGLFRIAQEALNNVTKHAKTHSAAVTLRLGFCYVLVIYTAGAHYRQRAGTDCPG